MASETLTLRFTVDGWDPLELPAIGGEWLSAVRMRKTFTGGLSGSSEALFVSSGSEENGRGYLAAERVTGTLDDGRSGSFVVHHGALDSPGDDSAFVHLIPGAGTGDFAAFRGSGRIIHDEQGPYFQLSLE